MAKQLKRRPPATEQEMTNEPSENEAINESPGDVSPEESQLEGQDGERRELSNVEIRALFAAAEEKSRAIAAVEESLEAAKNEHSDAVRAIMLGAGAGPFDIDGNWISITRRGERYHLKKVGSARKL